MYFRLRHIFFTSLALCLLTSCSAEDPDTPSAGAAMEFSVRPDTRSSLTDNAALSPFNVFGDMKRIDTGILMKMFENEPVTYNESTGRWEYDNKQFWFPYQEYSFVAIYPTPILSMPGADVSYANSRLSFTYEQPADFRQMPDILAATHRRRYHSGSAETVCLQFCHLLTQINIAPMLDDSEMGNNDYLEFYKFELKGFSTKSTFNITPASIQSNSQTDDSVITSHPDKSKENGSVVIEFADLKKYFNHKEPVNLLDDDKTIILLPQSFAPTSEAQMILTYSISGSPLKNQLILPLSNLNWEVGRSYTYTLIIDKWGLKLMTPTITDWVEKNKNFDLIVE